MANLYNICCDLGTFGFYIKNSGKLPLPPQAKLPPYAYGNTGPHIPHSLTDIFFKTVNQGYLDNP